MTNQNNQTKKPYSLVTLAFLPKSIVWSICRLSSVFLLDNLKATETVADNLFLSTCRKFLDMSKPYEIKQKKKQFIKNNNEYNTCLQFIILCIYSLCILQSQGHSIKTQNKTKQNKILTYSGI
jgi:hypothetical protein